MLDCKHYGIVFRSIILTLSFIVSIVLPDEVAAQKFYGTIKDSIGQPIIDCYVLVLQKDSNRVIDYVFPNDEGTYQFQLEMSDETSIDIKCQGLSYIPQLKTITLQKGVETYETNFTLYLRKQELDQVVIISDRIAIKVENDTVVYDVSKFKGVGDNKIINVLKNMPGIQVNERTGLIQYKGKPIETMLLDGDDLFGKSYSIGARNISSEIVDKVEAIEDYHKNRLKKGLKKSDKVALNLKFKKNAMKLSGELVIGLGKNSYLANINSINLSEKIKGFGVLNANNIAINESPFQSNTYSFENKEEIERYSTNIFQESSIRQRPMYSRSYENDLKFGTYNNLLKFSKAVKLKTSISGYEDITRFSRSSQDNFTLGNEEILISNELSNSAKPQYFTITNELHIELTKQSNLTYENRYVRHNNIFRQSNFQNNTSFFDSKIDLAKSYFYQGITYANKVSQKGLIELQLRHSRDNDQRHLIVLSQAPISLNGFSFNNEETNNNRQNLEGKLLYLKKFNNKFSAEFSVDHRRDTESSNITISSFLFYYDFRHDRTVGAGRLFYNKGKKLSVRSKFELGYSDRSFLSELDDALYEKKGSFINTNTDFTIKLNKRNNIQFTFENDHKLNNYYYFLPHPFLIDIRTITNSDPSLDFQKTESASMTFSKLNFEKQSSLSFTASYAQASNFILAEQNISNDLSIITYFQTPLTRYDIDLSANTSFFIDPIYHKVSINSGANYSHYFNSLNQSDISQAWSTVYSMNVGLNSAFDGFFNYKSAFTFLYAENVQDGLVELFINRTINISFEAIFKISRKAYCKLENELLIPDGVAINTNQLFMDFNFTHIGKKVEYFIIAKNLLDHDSFTQISTTEFSRSVFSTSLFRRNIVLGVNYKF